MKKSKFYLSVLFLSLLFCGTFVLSPETEAQTGGRFDFFIPKNAIQPRQEKLPPINAYNANSQNLNQPNPAQVQRAKRYIVVDGRFIPVIEKDNPTQAATNAQVPTQKSENVQEVANNAPIETPITNAENTVMETPAVVVEEIPVPTLQPYTPPIQPTLALEEPAIAIAPQTEPINETLPIYRNHYAQYLKDVQAFQTLKVFPYNEHLEKTMEKMSSENNVTIYDGVLE